MNAQGSNNVFCTASSIDRKTTHGGSTHNNSTSIKQNSSLKKKKSA